MNDDDREEHEPNARLELIVRTVSFQLRLLLDGLRDVALSPLSVLASIAGLLVGGDRPARYFDRLLGLGRRSEEWINLFGRYSESNESDQTGISAQQWESRLLAELDSRAQESPDLAEFGRVLNSALDRVNNLTEASRKRPPAESSGTDEPG